MSVIKENLEKINEEIRNACIKAGRKPEEITLVGVTKTKPAEMINEAIDLGIDNIGENYVQEICGKINSLHSANLHFIGHLQSNKAKYIVPIADLIQSADSLSLIKEINRQAEKTGKIQNILIEINISQESNKFGINPENIFSVIETASEFENIKIKGIMGMAPFTENKDETKPYFAKLKKIFDSMPKEVACYLSMGMSGDFRQAIEEGSNMVRIGSAIFGERNYNK